MTSQCLVSSHCRAVWASDEATRRVQRLSDTAGRSLGVLPAGNELGRDIRAAIVEVVATDLVASTIFGAANEEEHAEDAEAGAEAQSQDEGDEQRRRTARAWLNAQMRSRWKPMTQRYPRGFNKLRRFCAPGEAAKARAEMARVNMPAGMGRAVSRVSAALRALRALGGDALETGNLVEQLAYNVLGDARTAGGLLIWCFADEEKPN